MWKIFGNCDNFHIIQRCENLFVAIYFLANPILQILLLTVLEHSVAKFAIVRIDIAL
jgi:hypothetical protein